MKAGALVTWSWGSIFMISLITFYILVICIIVSAIMFITNLVRLCMETVKKNEVFIYLELCLYLALEMTSWYIFAEIAFKFNVGESKDKVTLINTALIGWMLNCAATITATVSKGTVIGYFADMQNAVTPMNYSDQIKKKKIRVSYPLFLTKLKGRNIFNRAKAEDFVDKSSTLKQINRETEESSKKELKMSQRRTLSSKYREITKINLRGSIKRFVQQKILKMSHQMLKVVQ